MHAIAYKARESLSLDGEQWLVQPERQIWSQIYTRVRVCVDTELASNNSGRVAAAGGVSPRDLRREQHVGFEITDR